MLREVAIVTQQQRADFAIFDRAPIALRYYRELPQHNTDTTVTYSYKEQSNYVFTADSAALTAESAVTAVSAEDIYLFFPAASLFLLQNLLNRVRYLEILYKYSYLKF